MNRVEKEFLNIPFFKNSIINNIEKINEGKNNQNFKVSTDSGVFFLKICHMSEVQKINREMEYLTLEKVYRAGFGPKPIAFDLKTNSIITEFLDMPAWTAREIGAVESLKIFGEAIHEIHNLSPVIQSYYIKDLLCRYFSLLENFSEDNCSEIKIIKPFFKATLKKMEAYYEKNDIKFCHNDLCYGHFLKGEKILFLDWEMAGMNDIYSDLAGFIHFHQLDNKQTELFLQAYSKTYFNLEKLIVHENAILLRELLWVLTKLQEGYTDYFYTDYRERCLTEIINRQGG